jgi:hypothetical protein
MEGSIRKSRNNGTALQEKNHIRPFRSQTRQRVFGVPLDPRPYSYTWNSPRLRVLAHDDTVKVHFSSYRKESEGSEEREKGECVDIFIQGVTNAKLLYALSNCATTAEGKYLDFRRFGETGRVFMEFDYIGLPAGESYVKEGGIEYALRLIRSGAIFKGRSGMEAISIGDAFLEREAQRLFLSCAKFTKRLVSFVLERVYRTTAGSLSDGLVDTNPYLAQYVPRTCAVVIAKFCEGRETREGRERPDLVAAAILPILSTGRDIFIIFHAAHKNVEEPDEKAQHEWLLEITNEWIGIRLSREFGKKSIVTDADCDDDIAKLSVIIRREGGSTVNAVRVALALASQEQIVDAAVYAVDSLIRRWVVGGRFRPGLLDTNTAYIEIALHASAAISGVVFQYPTAQIEPEDVLAALQFTCTAVGDCVCLTNCEEGDDHIILHTLGIPACLHPQKCFTDRVHFSRFGRQVCATSVSTAACPSRCPKCSWFAGLLSVIDDSIVIDNSLAADLPGVGPSSWFRFLELTTTNPERKTPRSMLAVEYVKAELSTVRDSDKDEENGSLDTVRRFVQTWF